MDIDASPAMELVAVSEYRTLKIPIIEYASAADRYPADLVEWHRASTRKLDVKIYLPGGLLIEFKRFKNTRYYKLILDPVKKNR